MPLTQEQRTHILRGLPKNSPVKYLGKIRSGKNALTKNSICHKVRNGRATRNGDRSLYMVVVHTTNEWNWYLPYADLTCKAIEVADRLEGIKK